MILYKTASAGNEFIHVNRDELAGRNSLGDDQATKCRLAISLCDHNNGPGGDGVVYYRIDGQVVEFQVFNRDGGEAELSGSGMAGLSAVLFSGSRFKDKITMNTVVGEKSHYLISSRGDSYRLKIEIGHPDFNDRRFFPFVSEDRMIYCFNEHLDFFPVSVGNPHAVVLWGEKFIEKELLIVGQAMESADIFPERTNVELVSFKNPEDCQVYFFERGVGKTSSSSTGSAAVFAVLKRLKATTTRGRCLTRARVGKLRK